MQPENLNHYTFNICEGKKQKKHCDWIVYEIHLSLLHCDAEHHNSLKA